MVTTIITAMAAYSNKRVAAIVLSVLYRMLTERGMLAFELANRLGIQNQWQVFASLWGTTSGALRSAYNRAIEQQKTMQFIEKLKNILP